MTTPKEADCYATVAIFEAIFYFSFFPEFGPSVGQILSSFLFVSYLVIFHLMKMKYRRNNSLLDLLGIILKS